MNATTYWWHGIRPAPHDWELLQLVRKVSVKRVWQTRLSLQLTLCKMCIRISCTRDLTVFGISRCMRRAMYIVDTLDVWESCNIVLSADSSQSTQIFLHQKAWSLRKDIFFPENGNCVKISCWLGWIVIDLHRCRCLRILPFLDNCERFW